MPTYTTNAPLAFLPDEVGQLVVTPVTQESVAIQASTAIRANGHRYRIPIVNADPAAVWTAEGQEIVPSDPSLSELVIDQYKIAGLTVVSNEMLNDATPESSQLIGARIAADIARKVDAAFFGSHGSSTVQPAGLADLPTTGAGSVTKISAGGTWGNLDVFTGAIIGTQALGVQVGAFVTSAADALAIGTIKDSSVSSRSLLAPDPTQPGRLVIGGVPVYVSPAVAAGVVWSLPAARSYVIINEDASIEVDRSVFFTSDRSAVRSVMRVGFGWPQPAAITKITKA